MPLVSLFLSSPSCQTGHFSNFYLMTCLPAGPSPGLCLPTGGVHASLSCGKGGDSCPCPAPCCSNSSLLTPVLSSFLSVWLRLRLAFGSCVASAGGAHRSRGCHRTVPAPRCPCPACLTSLACSCQPEASPVAEMPKALLGSYTGLLLGFYVFTIF